MHAPSPLPSLESLQIGPQRKPDVLSANCPSRVILNHVTSRWGVLVLIALRDETLRFSQLRRRIDGVSERMLAQTLQVLEGDGFIARKAFDVVPPHVEYSLTPLGREISSLVSGLTCWIEQNLPRIEAAGVRKQRRTAAR